MKRSPIIEILMEPLLFYSFDLALILFPYLWVTYVYEMPSGYQIEPALINGLLTTSSILFGVLTFVLAKQYEYFQGIEIRMRAIILLNVFLFMLVALRIFDYALGVDQSGVMALSWTMSSFNSNTLGALYALHRLRKMRM